MCNLDCGLNNFLTRTRVLHNFYKLLEYFGDVECICTYVSLNKKRSAVVFINVNNVPFCVLGLIGLLYDYFRP